MPRLHECASDFNMLRCVVFPTMSDIKISATHFAKDMGVVYMASRQEIQLFRPAVVKFTLIVVSFHRRSTTWLFSFISTTDARFQLYLRRSPLRNWAVGCQIEVTNDLK